MPSFDIAQLFFRKAYGMRICQSIVLFWLILCVAGQGFSQPQEPLQALVAQLQKNPKDDALREEVIRLARATKPEPAMPSEAFRLEHSGRSRFKTSKTPQDFNAVVREYEQALRLAPWAASLYLALGEAYEKMGDAAVDDMGENTQVRQSCRLEAYEKEKRHFDSYEPARKNFGFYLLAKNHVSEMDSALVQRRTAERRFRFDKWQYQWNTQCCLGCGDKRDSVQ